MYDPAKCLENARKIDPNAKLCDPSVCSEPNTAAMIAQVYRCSPPYPPQNPCPYGPNSPVTVYASGEICFCCGGQEGARVAADAGEARDLGDVWVGQMVRVARRGTN